ncbi:alpha/beta fold hydrolase [Agarivorans sp.]|uniref:alpha/beta fold hydrolase n=1 Tax=Agarivorans sp. TaxID=1872412 RepID=UPI003D03439A
MLNAATIAGLDIAYLEQARNSQYCLLMLHGWMDNAASFIPLIEQLPEQHCIAVDFPGHGHSKHRHEYYHFVDYVDDVYAVINQLELDKPLVLVGHSLGALVACTFAAAFPDRLQGLVLIDGIGPLSLEESATTTHLAKAIMQRHQLRPAKGFSHLEQAIKLRSVNSGLSEANSRLLVERATVWRDDSWYWRHDEKLKLLSPLRFSESQAKNICQSVSLASLLIAAKEFPLITPAQLAKRQQWFSQLDCHLISGGHHLHMENPSDVAFAIRQYIKTIV